MSSEHKPLVPLPSRESVIGAQVQTLLNICHTLAPFVLWHDGYESGGTPREHPESVEKIVSGTLLSVCDRLTSIVQDKALWSMDGQAKLEAALAEMYEANTKLLRTSEYSARLASAPVTLFKPTLGKTPDGQCFAVYGDIDKPGAYILGIGKTFEEAIQSFNVQFKMLPGDHNTVAADPIPEAEIVPNFTRKQKPRRKG